PAQPLRPPSNSRPGTRYASDLLNRRIDRLRSRACQCGPPEHKSAHQDPGAHRHEIESCTCFNVCPAVAGGRKAASSSRVTRSLLLGQQAFGIALGGIDQVVPLLLDILRRAALDRHMIGHIDRVHHVDGIPRANLGAVLAANATVEVDVAEGLQTWIFTRAHLVDAVHRANFHTGLTAGATVRVNDSQDLGYDLTRFAGQGRCGHVSWSSRKKAVGKLRPTRPPAQRDLASAATLCNPGPLYLTRNLDAVQTA